MMTNREYFMQTSLRTVVFLQRGTLECYQDGFGRLKLELIIAKDENMVYNEFTPYLMLEEYFEQQFHPTDSESTLFQMEFGFDIKNILDSEWSRRIKL